MILIFGRKEGGKEEQRKKKFMTKEQRVWIERTVAGVKDAMEAAAQAHLRGSIAKGTGRNGDAELAREEANGYQRKAAEILAEGMRAVREVTP